MTHSSLKELAHREQNGLEVTLLWDPRSNDVCVDVIDQRDDSFLRIPVAGRFALDAFHHPYAYARAESSAAGSHTQHRSSDSRYHRSAM